MAESASLHDQLTCVIPTRNRPAFLRRLLHFLSETKLDCRLLIVDSSEPDQQSETEAVAGDFASRFCLTYGHSRSGMITKCRQAMETVTTPFTVFCADDDFLFPDSVRDCISFLSQSPKHSCAQGLMVSLCTAKQNKCYVLPCYSLEQESALNRFEQFARNWFSTFYSVHRTPLLRRAWQVTDDNTDEDRARIFPEILLSQLSVLQGRVGYVSGVMNLREEHELNESLVVPEVRDLENSRALYEQFRLYLAQELAVAAHTSQKDAARVVDEHYGYLTDGGVRLARQKKTLSFRLKRSVRRGRLWLTDGLCRDAVHLRRRLNPHSRFCRTTAWRLAYQLMTEFPNGMTARLSRVA